ncbi:dTDP-glucose 4,6-dehydratase [Streptomyces sp. CoH27]|uniref:dTDP-glucose 4,6-dehydratase n=1 Tax=Streptomyces sp. CoH27 TaxID=2875763 RepID=UPI001CD322B4|nr:dTDP-glucose 4,6-dehydratase [Streptomyces sp. CoH27]
MQLLITGGAGFIGSHYVRTMLEGGFEGYADAHVTVVDKLTYAGNLANIPVGHPRLRFVEGDICDAELMRDLVMGQDAVVNFAAESHVDRSLHGAAEFIRTNVGGTQCLLDACLLAGVPQFVQVSTDEVYGSIDDGAWTEEWPLRPNSPYAAAKAGGDLIALAYAATHGMDVRITRCSNNYGPYQHIEKLIPLFVTRLLTGQTVPLYGDGRNVREWVHVDDHCRGIHAVLTKGRSGEIYNIGAGTALTNREMTDRLLRLCGADWSSVRHVEDRKGHDRRYALDDGKIRRELGYRPQVPFEQGLAETVEWYRTHPDWWEKLHTAPNTTR